MKQKLHTEWREFIELLLSEKVEFLIIGGIAVSFHGRPRFTGDIDFFIRISEENASRLLRVLERFGFGNIGLAKDDFLKADFTIQLGRQPRRIDLITGISGVTFDEAWNSRKYGNLEGLSCPFIARELLIRNKAATDRHKDRDDVVNLEKTKLG